jgi:adenylyltransferase/sulfurtransferase
LVPNCADAGVLGVLPGVVGVIQATEAIKLIVGAGDLLIGRLLVCDALDMAFREFGVERMPDCAVCGDQPTITAPMDPPGVACAAPAPGDRIGRLRPAELQQLLRAARSPPLFVDVREPRRSNRRWWSRPPADRSVPRGASAGEYHGVDVCTCSACDRAPVRRRCRHR